MTTTATEIKFAAYGMPATAGSKRALPLRKDGVFVRSIIVDDAGAKGKSWRSAVQDAARDVFSGDLLRGPLLVRFVFYMPRPKGHLNSKGLVKPSAPQYPAKKPDALKLARAVEDAITGIIWADDAQIVDEILAKRYGEPARCEIVIREL